MGAVGVANPDGWTVACEGNCDWVKLGTFIREFEQLEERDPVSHAYLAVLMEDAAGNGLNDEDYRAPIGLALHRLQKPWIGEFRTNGPEDHKGRCEQHRLYFGEAPEGEKSLVACLVGSKPSKVERRMWKLRQDKHIGMAMDRLSAWCRQVRVTCRILAR